jgi:hypothetical protein
MRLDSQLRILIQPELPKGKNAVNTFYRVWFFGFGVVFAANALRPGATIRWSHAPKAPCHAMRRWERAVGVGIGLGFIYLGLFAAIA